ncbi:hypothetical protein GCM10029992_34840 [Glycomyces albus]
MVGEGGDVESGFPHREECLLGVAVAVGHDRVVVHVAVDEAGALGDAGGPGGADLRTRRAVDGRGGRGGVCRVGRGGEGEQAAGADEDRAPSDAVRFVVVVVGMVMGVGVIPDICIHAHIGSVAAQRTLTYRDPSGELRMTR